VVLSPESNVLISVEWIGKIVAETKPATPDSRHTRKLDTHLPCNVLIVKERTFTRRVTSLEVNRCARGKSIAKQIGKAPAIVSEHDLICNARNPNKTVATRSRLNDHLIAATMSKDIQTVD